MIGTNPTPKIKPLAPYEPLPWQIPALRDKSPIVLLTGSAGGGKSRCAAEKIHAFMLKYPGATGLVLRKAREFVSKSAVPMLWHKVIGGVKSGIEMVKSDSLFRYKNGSMLWWGGMKDDDQREALRSIGQDGALDFVWMEEANRFTNADFDEILGRMRGKAADWNQILLSTNPDAPRHWINDRLIKGKQAHVYYSSAIDNPNNPDTYAQRLALMTGMLHDRLVKGLWVLAEGAIYDNFSLLPDGNVTEEAEYNPDLPVIWGVDDGYAIGNGRGSANYHPRVFLLGQVTGQGGLNIFAEYVMCLEQPEVSIQNVLALGYRTPDMVYVDSSAAQLKNRIHHTAGVGQTMGATHTVTEGIKNVRRLVGDGNGVRLLKIHPRCAETIGEFQSYHVADSLVAVVGEPKPAKVDDHCMDALRYMAHPLRFE